MSERAIQLYKAIGEADPALLEAAEAYRPKKPRKWMKTVSLAASLALVIGLGAAAVRYARRDVSRPADTGADDIGAGTAQDHLPDSGLGAYDGPVLPLTVSDAANLTAARQVTLDFADFAADWPYAVSVTDRYTLTNAGDTPVTVTAYYPFIGALERPGLPEITVDGESADAVLHTGPYTGSFRETRDANLLDEPQSFAAYRDLLSDGTLFASALAETPELDTPALVYELRGVAYREPDRYAVLEAEFEYGPETSVFTCGFHGDSFSVEENGNGRTFGVWSSDGHSRYIVAVGGDIEDLAVHGYRDATLTEPYGAEVNQILRYESTVGEFLDRLAAEYAQDGPDAGADLYFGAPLSPDLGADDLSRELRRTFALYSRLGSDPSPRYRWEQLERLLRDTVTVRRLMVLEFPVTVPAGGSVTVESRMIKDASTRFSQEAGRAVSRIDIAGALGTVLPFTSATGELMNTDSVTLLDPDRPLDVPDMTLGPTEIGEVFTIGVKN